MCHQGLFDMCLILYFLDPPDSLQDRREIGFISKLFLMVLQQNSLKTQTH